MARALWLLTMFALCGSFGVRADVEPAMLLRDVFPVASVERCARELSKDADLTQYSYEHFANDIERICRLLGYGPLNLFAGSYGTRAAPRSRMFGTNWGRCRIGWRRRR